MPFLFLRLLGTGGEAEETIVFQQKVFLNDEEINFSFVFVYVNSLLPIICVFFLILHFSLDRKFLVFQKK